MKKAFTLAEVLITLGVIGIVAAITLPSFINNYQNKVRSEQDRTVLYKLTKATDQMKSQGLIGNYGSTEDFVNTLKKHLKIAQICDNSHLESCWPTKTIFNADGEEIAVKDLKNGKDFNPEGYTSQNIGIITADGTPMILSYKDDCEALDPMKTYLWETRENKPVTNATSSCIAAIYDINGKGRPNKSGEDVKLFNVAHLGAGFECTEFAGVCKSAMISYTPMNVSSPEYTNYIASIGAAPCTLDTCLTDGDAWAGAMKACDAMGGRLPSRSELAKIASKMYNTTISPDQDYEGPMVNNPFEYIGYTTFWSNELSSDANYAGARYFEAEVGTYNTAPDRFTVQEAFCVKK